MDRFNIDLELVTSLNKVVTINLHGYPVISSSKDLFIHSRPFSIDSFTTFMDGFYDRVCFVSIHPSKQDRVIIPFVEYVPIQEEHDREVS